MLSLALLGCSWLTPTFHVAGVQPDNGQVGDPIAVDGEGFRPPLAITLKRGEWSETLVPTLTADTTLSFVVPEAPVGKHTLTVQQGDQTATLPFVVLDAPPEVPCARPYQANTELSLPDGLAVVVRFHPDGRTERIPTRIDAIQAIEVGQETRGDGSVCGFIHLRLQDGGRLLFEDGPTDLSARAATLGTYLGKPVE